MTAARAVGGSSGAKSKDRRLATSRSSGVTRALSSGANRSPGGPAVLAKMRRLRLTKLLLGGLAVLLASVVATAADAAIHPENNLQKEIQATRIRRDTDENLTTVLLVSARSGKSASPIGILSKTARTFVQDGASTEYATQVLGTTLDNGRLYAQILSTSSRVFYDKEPSPDTASPFVVYPSITLEDKWNFRSSVNDAVMENVAKTSKTDDDIKDSTSKEESNELKSNDIFNKGENNEVQFKPAKVRSDDLPTYTVKQDYVSKESNDDDQLKSFRPRVPKIFRPQPKVSPKKQDTKPLVTVTYHGFADFVTTVGDTVIVFSPSTAPALVGRPATTIKGDATLRPDDGIAVLKIKPTSVIPEQKKTETIQIKNLEPSSKFIQSSSKSNDYYSIADLQPSTVNEPEIVHVDESTTPLLLIPDLETESHNPTGLIKVIDSTKTSEGTTTHYFSSIYGTYIGTNYAQIIHTSSNVYFFPEENTKSYNSPSNEENSSLKENSNDFSDVLTIETTTENELGNDIIPLNQGRSIKGSPPKNQIPIPEKEQDSNSEEKISLATRLLPSTIYKTFTYFTTFFNTDGSTATVKTRESVSSEVTFLTELILPSSTQPANIEATSFASTSNRMEISSNIHSNENTNTNKQEIEEIQLIFKTIFTTYTYWTTFYDYTTSTITSRKETSTNVITQTIDPISTSINFDEFADKETSVSIVPTKVVDVSSIDSKTVFTETENDNYFTTEDTTENILTTLPDQFTLDEEQTTTEMTEPEDDKDDSFVDLEPSLISTENSPSLITQIKTYYKTYTYHSQIVADDETETETRYEVVTDISTEIIEPSSVIPSEKVLSSTTSQPVPPPEILAYLEALKKQKSQEEALLTAKKVQEQLKSVTEPNVENTTEDLSFTVTDETTILDDSISTEKMLNDGEILGSMRTDVKFTSSSGGSTVLDASDKKYNIPEDQELSETNHHDVEPAPTLLLQTSYTTYTYYTTMYNGDASTVSSRLETVTNVVTETIKPTAVLQSGFKTQQPLTYFTTYTYFTTLIIGSESKTISHKETSSNVVTVDTPSVHLHGIKTYRPFVVATPIHSINTKAVESKVASDNEIASPNIVLNEIPTIKVNELSSTISPEPVTLFTTYTYYTTSYVGNSSILNSRLETVTSVSYPDDFTVRATPRAIGGASPSTQIINTEDKLTESSKIDNLPKTGLLSTIQTSKVNDGTTTHFQTNIFGTYIDGLYAQVVETSTDVELPTPVYTSSSTPVLPTGVLSLNKGSIVDADEITTVYYTTKQIGSSINDLYVKITESTSSTKIDNDKLSTYTLTPGHRTGLVRLIKGLIEANDTTTYYQSKIIGTSIDGRYAQIIESTSSYLTKPTSVLNIAPTSTLPPNHATDLPTVSPLPAVIQSSISEDNLNNDSDQEEHENEDESNEQKSKKRSRLTFSSRKRTSSAQPLRPFALKSRPTFNPKRKPQATTITRTDITPTITATLAGKGSRFASSRGRTTSSSTSSFTNASNSRRFAGRKSSTPSSSLSPTNYASSTTRNRGSIRATPSSAYSGSRRGTSSIRGSSIRLSTRGSSLVSSLPPGSRYRPVIRPSSTFSKVSSTTRQDDQEDGANEYTTATLITEETPTILDDSENDTTIPIQTTTESSKKLGNPLLRFRRPPAFGSGIRSTTPKVVATTTSPKRVNNASRQNVNNRTSNNKTRPTISSLTTKARQSQSSLFPPRGLFGRKPDVTEATIEKENESFEEDNFEDEPVEEIEDNDYQGSEQQENAPPVSQKVNEPKTVPQIRPFTRTERARRVRRQVNQTRPLNSRFRRPSFQAPVAEDKIDSDLISSKEDFPKINSDSRYGSRGRSLTINPRSNFNGNKDERSSEEYIDTPQTRSRSKSTTNRSSPRVKPSPVNNSNRQFTLREKESISVKPNFKRNGTPSRSTNLRTRNNPRSRAGTTNRYQDVTNSRRSSSRTSSRGGTRGSNRRITPSRGRLSSHEDYRDSNDFDGTITVTHYVPTEVTIPVVNNGITEKRNIITAQASKEIIGPDRYSTITNTDGRDILVLASEKTGTNFQGQIEVTRFFIHETPTTKVSHMLTSSNGRRFSQPVIVPSTIYSIENVVSTSKPAIADNAPLANILLSQLLLGQLGQQNPLVPAALTAVATPSTRYDTRATTYVTTITKQQSTVIPLTFRGKEILTTLIDSSIDVVTATEFITDTIVVTPTVALPAANLNSLLFLLQQSPIPQQSNPLVDPLLAAAPLLSQSNTLPGEVERRNQPVDFDYKPESYEDLSDEDTEKSSKTKGKIGSSKASETETPETSVITLYVSGRRPGEFSTVLSTVKVNEESTSTKIKRDINKVTATASFSPTLQAASEPMFVTLAGSEEPIDAHSPTQSLESVVGDVGRHISTSIHS